MTPDDIAQQGELVVTRAEDGEIIMVSRQNSDGKVLSVIASTTHAGGKPHDKAGMVPEGWQLVPRVLTIEMDIAFCEAWFSRRRPIDDSEMQDAWDAALEAAPQPPTHIPDAGKMVSANPPEAGVTDEMVERAARAVCPSILGWDGLLPHEQKRYLVDARAALTAALATQTKTPEAGGEFDHSG